MTDDFLINDAVDSPQRSEVARVVSMGRSCLCVSLEAALALDGRPPPPVEWRRISLPVVVPPRFNAYTRVAWCEFSA